MRHVLFPFIGQEIGGSHVSAFTLGQSLLRDFGHRITVIARGGSLIVQEAASLGFEVIETKDRAAGRHDPVRDFLAIPRRTALLRRIGPAIVHTNDIGALQSWIIPSKLARLPVIYHHRALNRRVLPNTALIRAADRVIAISEDTRRSVDFLPEGRVDVITDPFAIDRSCSREASRRWLCEEFGLASDALVVGFVGNFWHRKRPEFFLAAAREIARAEPRAVFVFFGRDGELTVGDLKAEAERLGIADRVIFAGFRLPVERNICALDLLSMPAVREPFGRTPIEAALLGTPYVATDDAGHAEIGRRWHGGRLVPVEADAAAFAAASLEVLHDPGSVLLSPDARAAVAADVGPRRHAERVIEIYEALERRGRATS